MTDRERPAAPLTHVDASGRVDMVDTSDKSVTRRVAEASCFVVLAAETVGRLAELPKGDALVVAQVAGVQAAKRTADWIPLAHPLPLEQISVRLDPQSSDTRPGVRVSSRVVAVARTGAEMEALVACAAAALALYDMVKAIDRGAVIDELRLEHKSGGRSGDYRREAAGDQGGETP